ncbi:MAG: hypothetical protein KUG57_05420 [Ilumatobacteraceae bacterium]|nr:hypothetical protein [Ilumatobacteraceae bacterium]
MADEPSIELEIEVEGTPEEVWRAIATGPGISSWYVPHTVEGDGPLEVSIWAYLYGADGAAAVERDGALWREWLTERSPKE